MTTALLITATGLVHYEIDEQVRGIPEELSVVVREAPTGVYRPGQSFVCGPAQPCRTFRRITRGAEPVIYEEVA